MNDLKNLRTQFDRFCYRNRNKGIPNLMLYIVLGNAIVLIMSMFNGGEILYNYLCFDKASILNGQVWRLVTYIFTQSSGGMFALLFLYFFYLLGRQVELSMGTLKFNLYYLSGVLLMDIFAMIFSPGTPSSQTDVFAILLYQDMAYYLHLSLILTFATTHPDAQFVLFFFIPIKAWVMALIYLALTLSDIFNLSYPTMFFPHNLFPLVALGNYLLFTGSDILNLMPASWRMKHKKKQQNSAPSSGTIPFRQTRQQPEYNHRCTVCGRTDVSNPELEFRYCSQCNGYHCYCEDHISNHEHIK